MRPEVGCAVFLNAATCIETCRAHTESFVCFPDLRQELAVRERASDTTRMSAPSSPTLDTDKMDTAVQASLSLPATPVGKTIDHPFMNQKGIQSIGSPFSSFTLTILWLSPIHNPLPVLNWDSRVHLNTWTILLMFCTVCKNHWLTCFYVFISWFSVDHCLWKLPTHPICKDLCSQHCWWSSAESWGNSWKSLCMLPLWNC